MIPGDPIVSMQPKVRIQMHRSPKHPKRWCWSAADLLLRSSSNGTSKLAYTIGQKVVKHRISQKWLYIFRSTYNLEISRDGSACICLSLLNLCSNTKSSGLSSIGLFDEGSQKDSLHTVSPRICWSSWPNSKIPKEKKKLIHSVTLQQFGRRPKKPKYPYYTVAKYPGHKIWPTIFKHSWEYCAPIKCSKKKERWLLLSSPTPILAWPLCTWRFFCSLVFTNLANACESRASGFYRRALEDQQTWDSSVQFCWSRWSGNPNLRWQQPKLLKFARRACSRLNTIGIGWYWYYYFEGLKKVSTESAPRTAWLPARFFPRDQEVSQIVSHKSLKTKKRRTWL